MNPERERRQAKSHRRKSVSPLNLSANAWRKLSVDADIPRSVSHTTSNSPSSPSFSPRTDSFHVRFFSQEDDLQFHAANAPAAPSRRGMTDAKNPQRRGPRESRRNLRLRLACARCQRRKIRCDGNVPTCNNCKKAAVECTDGESLRLGDLPRAHISRLRQRIQWLESIISTRCPDVDLAQGPSSASPEDDDGDSGVNLDTATAGSASTVQTSVSQAPDVSHTEPRNLSNALRFGGRQPEQQQSTGLLSHEIGLVSLNGSQDPRYIGPSSGHFLARVMLATNRRDDDTWRSKGLSQGTQPIANELVEALQGPLPYPPERQARLLCEQYFEVIHAQYPILHRPTFFNKLSQVLVASEPEPEDAFQVFMVLAIGSVVTSNRRRMHLPAESYCLSALSYLDSINVENSVQGLQCLLLLMIFTIHCSNMKLNVWYLNYQCIAAVLDLGLQRNITTKSGITLLDQEMRTRIFWVVIMLDRRVATMMGRPIGLRDEACDLRLPQSIEDENLTSPDDGISTMTAGTIDYSIHLFKLAGLNSEIKYVANSVNRGTPGYAYPAVINYIDWQRGMLQKLDEWAAGIPMHGTDQSYMRTICEIQYQSLKTVLLRPSPAIPNPGPEPLRECHDAATQNLKLIGRLYKSNQLVHSWDIFYSLVLSAITRMYCIKTVPELSRSIDAEVFLADMGDCLGILSATGEHWPGAKRCRDILDDLVRALVRWLKEPAAQTGQMQQHVQHAPDSQEISADGLSDPSSWTDTTQNNAMDPLGDGSHVMMQEDLSNLPFFSQDMDLFPGTDWSTLPSEAENMDAIIRNLFDDFIPNSGDFGQSQFG